MNCSKCIHATMCKYLDKLPEIQAQFPFVEDFTCKYMIKAGDLSGIPFPKPGEGTGKTVKVKAERQRSKKAENITEPISEEVDVVVITETPEKKRRKKKEEPAKEEKQDSDSFSSLSIESAFGKTSDLVKELKKLGCILVKDVYSVDKEKLGEKYVGEINTRLSIFNQPGI